MKAAVLYKTDEELSVEADLTQAPLRDSEVRVQVEGSGVCHSDLTAARGLVPFELPVILGHEAVGRVIEVGRGVSQLRAGDRVIASLTPVCGTCWYCVRDETHLCTSTPERAVAFGPDGRRYTRMAGIGAFADELTTSETMLVKVETDLPSAQIALIGCAVSTGVGAALNTAGVQPGASAVIIGCGGVGQAIIQGASIAGASQIIAIDPVPYKLDMAKQLGATETVDPSSGDLVEQVRELTGGRGADYTFEATGRPELILSTFDAARRGGTVVVVGMPPAAARIDLPVGGFFRTGKRLLGSYNGSSQVRRDFRRLISFAESGRLNLSAMVSRTIGLDQIDEAFRAMEDGEVIRSVIV